jgi:ADP-ribosylglycohydrolase
MLDPDRTRGAVLGAAAGDALGTPIEGLSHQNVRTYYRGLRGYRADEKRGDRAAGEGTHRTARLLALADAFDGPQDTPLPERVAAAADGRALPRWDPAEGARPTASFAAAASPLGVWAAQTAASEEALLRVVQEAGVALGYRHTAAHAAAFGQATAVRTLLEASAEGLDSAAFVGRIAEAAARAETAYGADSSCSRRLRSLADHLDEYPLDLQDRCAGTGPAADEAWPFAVAMAARNPTLLEATLLSAVNVGGDAPPSGPAPGHCSGRCTDGAPSLPPSARA